MEGVRTAEGGEGVAGAMIRARIRVDGRLAGSLQALLGAPLAACSGCDERDAGIGHGKRRSRTGLARVCRDVPDLIGHELVAGQPRPVQGVLAFFYPLLRRASEHTSGFPPMCQPIFSAASHQGRTAGTPPTRQLPSPASWSALETRAHACPQPPPSPRTFAE